MDGQAGDWQLDARLLERWRGGDPTAGDALYQRHCNAVIRFFRNKVHTETDELVQQTFVRLIEGRDRIREGVAIRAYVLGIARHVLNEHYRGLQVNRSFNPSVDAVETSSPGPSSVVTRRQEHRLVVEGLRRLPLDHQIVLELFYWEGLKSQEIAAVMGISDSTTRSRIARARALLKELIVELGASAPLIASTVGDLDEWARSVHGRRLGES